MEVIIGAYLTQNTSWKNVDLALRQLRSRRALSLRAIRQTSLAELERMIRPAGYFRQKAARLKTFVKFLDSGYAGSLKRMFAEPTQKVRQELLSLSGVGPETADSILLYAGQHPVFVVDSYARRIVDRHKILVADSPYDAIRVPFEKALAEELPPGADVRKSRKARSFVPDTAHLPSPMSRAQRSPLVQVFNEAHALIVAVGKHYCFKSNPDCQRCPLGRFLPKS
jgi:endonuclease III related protein